MCLYTLPSPPRATGSTESPVTTYCVPFQSLQECSERRRQLLETFDARALYMQENEEWEACVRICALNVQDASPPPLGFKRAFLSALLHTMLPTLFSSKKGNAHIQQCSSPLGFCDGISDFAEHNGEASWYVTPSIITADHTTDS